MSNVIEAGSEPQVTKGKEKDVAFGSLTLMPIRRCGLLVNADSPG